MKKSLLIYGNFIGIIVLGFLIFAVWTVRFNKPQVIENMSRKNKKNSARNKVDSGKVATKSIVVKTQVDSGIIANKITSPKTPVDSGIIANKIITTKTPVDSGKIVDKITSPKTPVDSGKIVDKITAPKTPVDSGKIVDKITAPKTPVDSGKIVDKITAPKTPVDSGKVVDKITAPKTPVDRGKIVDKITSPKTPVDSGKIVDKITAPKTPVDSGIIHSTAKATLLQNKETNSEKKEVSLEDAVALAEKQVEEKNNFAKKIEDNKRLTQILKDKLFIPYRGAKIIGPSGDEMPTTVAPKNLELVGVCALGGQEGAMIVVPQRKQLDKAEVLNKLKQVGSSEWAKWMVDHYMQGGRQRIDVKVPNNDVKTAGEWQSMMDEIFTEMEYNKVFFVIGEEVYDEFILTGLLADGVILTKGAQEYFLPMISNSRDVARRNKAEIQRQDRNVSNQTSYLQRQKRILQWRNWRSKYYVKQKSSKNANSAQGASYSFGQGTSPKW